MRICIVTDAWQPQVNGVVRTLEMTRAELAQRGHEVTVIGPDRFWSIPCPTYPEIRLALAGQGTVARHIEAAAPHAMHIATEGPLGWAARKWAMRRGAGFTTAYHTQFPDYVAKRTGLPKAALWRFIARFHQPAAATLVATDTLAAELADHGIGPTMPWSRGVDPQLFRTEGPCDTDILYMPGPRLLYVGRVAVEKNLRAFLDCAHPGTRFVVGDGPQRTALEAAYPGVHFLGTRKGEALAACYRAADAFVFPSRTDTFGLVMIEALACGVPVAAFPVPGPIDIVTPQVGALDEDLAVAIAEALLRSRDACARHGGGFTWQRATDQFESALHPFAAPALT